MVERVAGMNSAAPTPIPHLAATSCAALPPVAPATEASAQSASPATNARRRPYVSLSVPAASTQPPRVSA